MLPASLYTPLYHHAMLLVVFGCALVYWSGSGQAKSLAQFNWAAMIAIGVGVLVFMGFRPVSWVFVDMPSYAGAYELVQQGGDVSFGDWLFDGLMRLCIPVLPVRGFFFVCALIYIAPLAIAFWRVHGAWAFPVFLACVTAFSFWVYGVNGIRNGMATSVLLLAFAFHDKPVVMFPLMAAAWGFHGAALLPAGAFLLVRYVKRTEIWFGFWVLCVVVTFIAGNVGEMLLSRYNPFAWDERVDRYIVNSAGSGFRADFLAYSIVPVLVTLMLAVPVRARLRRFAVRARSSPALNWMRNRSVMTPKRVGMGRLAGLHGATPVGSLALAGFGPISRAPHSALGATPSTLNSQLSTLNPQPSSRSRTSASSAQAFSVPYAGAKQSGWNRLPWVQFLRTDPFYARLVNTYLCTNAIWVLVIHASFSNRFAYLSWFMMPWVLLYPFVPGKTIERPRTGFIAAILFAHYMFTYLMVNVVYPLRGGGLL
jgi:hypothetical protein